jgi:predicted AlkP superfamily phosphohydrolase/phosphomutase
MPNIGRLIGAGHLHRMKASLPEISAVSWTNFMTGTNPAEHGIFGFTDFKANSYEVRFPNFLDLKRETFWDILGDQGKKCLIINQPSTYPARRINGILISGFVALELAKSVYPASFRPALEEMGYQIDIDTLKSRESPSFLWQELQRTLAGRRKALEFFWGQEWDYFELVFTGTDRLHHFLWNAYADEGHPYHQNFLDFYCEIDKIIDTIAASFSKMGGQEEHLFFLSDHGFSGIEQEVYLNAWLEKENFLKFTASSPRGLEDIDPSSTAFALDPNRIYIHLKHKFPQGWVGPQEKEKIKEEVSGKLRNLDYNGHKVVRQVFDAAEIYSGPHLDKGPDLLVLARPGFDMKGSVKKKEVFGRTSLQGMHTWDDAFFLARQDYGQNLAISDLAKIILESYS